VNTFEAAVIARLKAAGLLAVAERAAKRVDLRLADCISPGEVTGGHRALWTALATEKKTAGQIAVLVGFPAESVRAEIPAAGGPRVRKVPPPPAPAVAPPMPTRFAELLGAVSQRVERVAGLLHRADEELAALARDVTALHATADGAEAAASSNARAMAIAHLRAHGDTGEAVAIAKRHGVAPELLLSGSMHRAVSASRREIAFFFSTEKKLSFGRIGRMLNVRPSGLSEAAKLEKRRREAA